MDIVQKWFEESKDKVRVFIQTDEQEYIIYKGFKITKFSSGYKIQDVRLSDFYSEVKESHFKILVKHGFIRGADAIVYTRNKKRVRTYTKKIEELYDQRKEYQKNLKKNKAFYEKKLRNCQENINKNIDLLFLYKSRISNHESKYNINVKKEVKNKGATAKGL